jgi:hypothetical protein
MTEMCGKALDLKQNLLEVFMSFLGSVILQALIWYSEFIYQNCTAEYMSWCYLNHQ